MRPDDLVLVMRETCPWCGSANLTSIEPHPDLGLTSWRVGDQVFCLDCMALSPQSLIRADWWGSGASVLEGLGDD